MSILIKSGQCLTNTKVKMSYIPKKIHVRLHLSDPQRPDIISVDGTMNLCNDLDIEPTQLEFLLLSHQLNSERMGEFSREGFINGCTQLEADSIDKLKKKLQTTLINNYHSDEGFRKIYNYAFLFGRQTGQKSLGNSILFYHSLSITYLQLLYRIGSSY